jgi:transcriptional regulator with PAS, ATPase and Fis domain
MSDLNSLFEKHLGYSELLNALPCGILIIASDGKVITLNDVVEHVFGINQADVIGESFGKALCCFNSCADEKECGTGAGCVDCEIRNLALLALHSNQRKKRRVSMKVNIDRHIKDVSFLICAAPLKLGGQRLGLLTIEDITNLKSILPKRMEEGLQDIVCGDKKMKALCETVKKIAQINAPVLIQGESGTGKELVAHAIHRESSRAENRFVTVNCGALPTGLLESELFGHAKGAFTGANYDKKGRFELADGGSIFLDEVAELTSEMQVKFLRVLQDGGFERVGETRTRRVDVRVISATNVDLEKAVAESRFRRDLYYRLCVMPVNIPPLRERGGDIELLADHFLLQFSEDSFRSNLKFSEETIAIFNQHQWPGNCREMQNVIQYALVQCQADMIKPKHLPPNFFEFGAENFLQPRRKSKLDEKVVLKALQKAGGNKRRAADFLGVSRSTLYRFFERQRGQS